MSSCCGCKKKCPPKTIFKLWEGSYTLTTPIDPITFVPPVSSGTTNAVFLLDASDPSMSANSHGSSTAGDMNGDGKSNSIFDESLKTVEDIMAAWAAQGTSTDVNIQLISFESQIPPDVPSIEPATLLSTTPLNLSSSLSAALTAFAARPDEIAFGDNNSGTFDQGIAYYAPAFEAANNWLASQPQGAGVTNLVYVLTGSQGFDTGVDYVDASIPGFGQDGTPDGHIKIDWLPPEGQAGVVQSDLINQLVITADTYGVLIKVLNFGSAPFTNSPLYPIADFNNYTTDMATRQALPFTSRAALVAEATGDLPA